MSATPTPPRLPSLDGLRAISISLVLYSHLAGTGGFARQPVFSLHAGNFGVRVFFVISGYLISTLLFSELERTGKISLGKFYFRRAFRIFPAFYATVAVVGALATMGALTLAPGDVAHAMTYTTNYHYVRAWNLGHMWSLAVEEQFYLLWPAALLFFGKRRGLQFAAAFVLLGPAIRIASLKLHLGPEAGIGESFQTIGDSIAAGCLLAGVQSQLRESPRYRAFQDSALFVAVPLLVFGFAFLSRRPLIDFAVGQTTMNIGIALIVDWAIRHHDGRIGRLLNARPLVFVGTLSYSLYLWQQMFLNRKLAASYTAFPVNILLATAAALVSYYVIEKPFLRLREGVEPRWFPRASPRAVSA